MCFTITTFVTLVQISSRHKTHFLIHISSHRLTLISSPVLQTIFKSFLVNTLVVVVRSFTHPPIKTIMTSTTTMDMTVTNIVSQTDVVAISPTTALGVTTTVTCRIATTLLASEGQTITITSPSPPPYGAPTTKYTPATTTLEHTVTQTEIDIYLQNAEGHIYSTWIIPLSPASLGEATGPPQPSLLVIQPPPNHDDNDEWDTWSKGEKAGLIIGVVLGALLLLGLILWCCRRRNIWFAQGWWPWMTQTAPPQAAAPPLSVVQPTYINGPLMPYGYNQGHGYNQGYAYPYAR